MIFPSRFELKGKVAVVTGGAGLIGSAICRALGQAGAWVFIAELDVTRAEALAKALTKEGYTAEAQPLDITREDSIKESVDNVVRMGGQLDVWVNNAYPRTKDWGTRFEDVKVESLRANVDMHMNGYFLCCQHAFTQMKEARSGVIVNIGSHYGVLGPNFSVYDDTAMTMPAAYSMIKGGVVNFTRYLATYGAKYNIRVNALCPGGVFDNQNETFVERYNKLVPLGRMATPEDIASPVLFLCTEAASYVTGQVMLADGGLSAW